MFWGFFEGGEVKKKKEFLNSYGNCLSVVITGPKGHDKDGNGRKMPAIFLILLHTSDNRADSRDDMSAENAKQIKEEDLVSAGKKMSKG